MVNNHNKGVYFDTSLISDLGLDITEALVLCQLSYLTIRNIKSTFMKSIATAILYDKKTVSETMRRLSDKKLINYTFNKSEGCTHSYELNVSANPTFKIYYESLKKKINKAKGHQEVWLVWVDFTSIKNARDKNPRSSKLLHNVALIRSLLESYARRKRYWREQNAEHTSKSNVTFTIDHGYLAKKTGLCLNTVRKCVSLLIADAKLTVIGHCDTLRRRIVSFSKAMLDLTTQFYVRNIRNPELFNQNRSSVIAELATLQPTLNSTKTTRVTMDEKTRAFVDRYKK